jgi:hypothetical protein
VIRRFPETEINGEKAVSLAVKIGENRENLCKNRVLLKKKKYMVFKRVFYGFLPFLLSKLRF